METQRFDLKQETAPAKGGDRSLLVGGLVVLVTIAALIATSVAGTSTAVPAVPTAAAPEVPYFPAQFETQSQAAEPATPVATF